MTSSKGAGYTSAPTRSGSGGMPPSTAGGSAAAGGASSSGSAAARAVEQCEALEERVHQLLEDAAARVAAGDASGGVDAARDAAQREQRLCALLEQSGQGEQISLDLKFAVSLGLAAAYEANQQLGDALAVYNQVLRSRLFPQAGWLRINMGAIHFAQQDYAQAVKQFRMGLDTTPPAYRRLRLNTMRNIGLAAVRSGRYQEATGSFAAIMQDGPDHQTALNLVLCAVAAGDADLMRQSFVELLQVPPYTDDSLADESSAEERDWNLPGGGEPDALHLHLRRKQTEAEGYILTAARLIAPLLQPGSWSAGFDWCRERLNAASYGTLASEVQLARANEHLARKEYAAAVALLKEFGRSDSRQRAAAAVNLSTLSLLEGQMEAAAGYGDYCCEADPSSPAALVSRGNVHMAAGQAEAALQLYEDALQLDGSCLQALFNAGLACRDLGLPDRALALMQQLLHASPGHAEAMWQAAELCEELEDGVRALDWLTRLLTRAPHDSGVLSRLGALHAKMGDEAEALACYSEAFASDRANLDCVSWLGAHHVRRQDYLAAVPYFEAAGRVQPRESKWPLMVAGCLRRVGRLEAALLRYREVYRMAPTNTEALRYLSQLSQEFGLQEDVQKFSSELARIERMQAAAAGAAGTAAAAVRPGTALGRLTAQRPPTSSGRSTGLPGLGLPPAARVQRT
ncbi:hypothetical protein D9Q98_003783 [Chlorella vulgaris]|uniref:Uncharacterized protein n=1 Tax=Chlorella vulgaris TaxID=3077 RepID=A0A9D4YXX3_CHLVU|nr:hypothetical protein D9Q98_003783 [Chlorella vulgaris]